MDIAIASEYFPRKGGGKARGGVEYRAYYVARELSKMHDVTVYTVHEEGQPDPESFDGFNVEYVGPQASYTHASNILKRLLFMCNLAAKMRRANHDLSDAYSFMAYPAGYHSKSGKKIVTYHDVWKGRWRQVMGPVGVFGEPLEGYVLSRGWDRFIAVSEYTRKNLVEAGVQEDRISVVHNGVDFKELSMINEKKRGAPTISVVARLVHYKRVGDAITALYNLKSEFPGLRLEIVGTGPMRQSLERKAEKLGVRDSVVFHGFVESHLDVLRIVAASHAFVLPSIVEGFGITVLEAMGVGVPYAASDIPPVREATQGGRGGLLYAPGDPQALTESLRQVLEGGVKADPRFVEDEYDWKNIAVKVAQVYRDLF